MAQLRNEFIQGMKAEMYAYYFESYDKHTAKYPEIFDVRTSGGAYEKTTSVIMPGVLQKKVEGEPIQAKKLSEGYTVYIKNDTYAVSIPLSKEAVDDNRRIKEILRKAAAEFGDAVAQTKDVRAATIFNEGGKTAGHEIFNGTVQGGVVDDPSGNLCYDGKPFFNLSDNLRSSKGRGTYYNGLALGLTHANLKIAYNLYTDTNAKDEKDEKIALLPDVLVVPTALKFTAEEILKSQLEPHVTVNTKNVLADIVELVVSPFLTTANSWALGKRGKGIVFYERQGPEIDFWQDKETKSYIVDITIRFGPGVENWRYWVGSNFPTS